MLNVIKIVVILIIGVAFGMYLDSYENVKTQIVSWVSN